MGKSARIVFTEHDELDGKEVYLTNKQVGDNGLFVWESDIVDPKDESKKLKFKENQVRFLDDMSLKERVLHYVEGYHTDVVFTEEKKLDIVSEIECIPDITEAIHLLEEVKYALNAIPNQKEVGMNGESSYDMAAKVSRFLKEHKETYGEN